MFGVSTFGQTATSYLQINYRLPKSPPCRPEGGSISTFQHQQLHWNSNFFTTSHPLWSLDVSCLIMSNKQLVRFVAWIEMWVNRRGCVCPPRHFNKARFVGPGSLKSGTVRSELIEIEQRHHTTGQGWLAGTLPVEAYSQQPWISWPE